MHFPDYIDTSERRSAAGVGLLIIALKSSPLQEGTSETIPLIITIPSASATNSPTQLKEFPSSSGVDPLLMPALLPLLV